MINYLAMNVDSLHKVKLMKMLWYLIICTIKETDRPLVDWCIVLFLTELCQKDMSKLYCCKELVFDTVRYGENIAYRFKPSPGFEIKNWPNQRLKH